MLGMNFKHLILLALLIFAPPPAALGESPKITEAHLQFFGDLYLPWHVLKQTKTTAKNLNLFQNLKPLLRSSRHNIVNFEGVSTGASMPLIFKTYLLKMPLYIDKILKNANIGVATLANNHAMDYGYAGLFDTQATLARSDIATTGAGKDLDEATRPILLKVAGAEVCLLAFSLTLPPEHWANKNIAGTAHQNFTRLASRIKACKQKNDLTFVSYHWGEERSQHFKKYQQRLAQLSIRSGADAVIGHHPHVLQEVVFYRGKPIFYSLGNFTFGSRPYFSAQQGAGVRMTIQNKKLSAFEIIPLKVQNTEVNFVPALYSEDENSQPLEKFMLETKKCRPSGRLKSYLCKLP